MVADTDTLAALLLIPSEPPAFEIVNPLGTSSAVLVCDHASHQVPAKLGTLGLEPHQLADHIGWDPGAAKLARRLSAQLDAPLLLSCYSRLVIDCNRPIQSGESIAVHSAGVPVPGNRGLASAERSVRVNALFRPYHRAIDRLLDSRAQRPTVLLSMHSFTPMLNARRRPWHMGISHWRDPRLANLMLGVLAEHGGLVVGDNEPYPIDKFSDYTIPVHGEGRGLPSMMIEIRQDGIRTAEGVAAYASRLAAAYLQIEDQVLRLCSSSVISDNASDQA